ncbi:MAG: flagellar hook-basal body complex protein FliE [Bdellovibrionales bacterium]|nr:flagellar hook-basal body complex protein FliE [Bdellovibrionales bacterium]
MDGLTISNADTLIDRGQTLKEIRNSNASIPKPSVGGTDAAEGKSFADTLKDAVNSVNTMQKESDVKMQELATGKTKNIHDVMLTAERADVSLRLMTQVRNKIIEAYQEIMKMQV